MLFVPKRLLSRSIYVFLRKLATLNFIKCSGVVHIHSVLIMKSKM